MQDWKKILPLMIMLGVVVFAAVFLAAGAIQIQNAIREAEALYGPPVEGISLLQQVRLSKVLVPAFDSLHIPGDTQGDAVEFLILSDESAPNVISRMAAAGLIQNEEAFTSYMIYRGYDRLVKSGRFMLSPVYTPVQMAEMLVNPDPGKAIFSILPGWRLEEIAMGLPTSGLNISQEAFLSFCQNAPANYPLSQYLPSEVNSLEGYLLPGLYELDRETDLTGLMAFMADEFERRITTEMRLYFEDRGLSVHEALTLASIIQRESNHVDEYPLIASVFYNRLQEGMRLESDPTVQYMLGYDAGNDTWWTPTLYTEDLQTYSPYNTYTSNVDGLLPPSPISAPSDEVLQAVATPLATYYFYFRTACDNSGTHVFAQTYVEHVGNACR